MDKIFELLEKLEADTGETCYVSLFSDRTGFLMTENVPQDRFLLEFKNLDDAVVKITEYLEE